MGGQHWWGTYRLGHGTYHRCRRRKHIASRVLWSGRGGTCIGQGPCRRPPQPVKTHPLSVRSGCAVSTSQCLSRSLRNVEAIGDEKRRRCVSYSRWVDLSGEKAKKEGQQRTAPHKEKENFFFLCPALRPMRPRLISLTVCACELPVVSCLCPSCASASPLCSSNIRHVSPLSIQTTHACDFKPVSHCTTRGRPCEAQLSSPIVLESLYRVVQPGCCDARKARPLPCRPRVRTLPDEVWADTRKSQNQ